MQPTTTTTFSINDVVKFVKSDDPLSGVHAIVTAINPLPNFFVAEEHYRIYVPGLDETYAFAHELKLKESNL